LRGELEVKRLLAYKFRLRTKPSHEALFRRFAGCRRWVWNHALALQKARYERGEKRLNYAQLCKELTGWRNDPETSWLAESPSPTQQQTLRDLDKAYAAYFKKTVSDLPTFKKKGKSIDAFRYADPDGFSVDSANGRVKLPKVGWVRYRNSRKVKGTAKNITISHRGDHWYVSIQVEQDVPAPLHPHPESSVGIDVGVKNFASFSNGTPPVPPINAYRGIEHRLAGLQRRMASKIKFSGKWRRLKRGIERVHQRAASRRANFLHQLTNTISKNHATVFVEDLRIRNMTASAKGTIEEPGRNVAQKSSLNKSILDQGWGEFNRQLGYKLEWRGGKRVATPAPYTSMRCSQCGHVAAENRPTRDRFHCIQCSHKASADDNAAQNIIAAGRVALMHNGLCSGRGPTPT
jgi:putative transposase